MPKLSDAQGMSNIFELRPPRVRIATSEEAEAHIPQSYSFSGKPVVLAESQDSFLLTENDPLVAVFPVRDVTASDMSVYELNALEINGFDISIDFYIFQNPLSGSTDSISPPLEQTAYIGNLPAGDYAVRLRYWALALEDQSGFDPSTIPLWTPPQPPGSIGAGPPERYYTDARFTFAVVVPEPSAWLLGICSIGLFVVCHVAHRGSFCHRRPAWVRSAEAT